MENRRGGRLAAAPVVAALVLAALSPAAGAACPLLPGEQELDYRLVDEGRAIELRRHGVPDSAPPLCRLQLACRIERTVRAVGYTLRPGSIVLGDIAAVHFELMDGTSRHCPVVAQ